MISDAAALGRLIEQLAPFHDIGFDTEADSLHCYHEKICLVQISVPGEGWLVDPLAGISLDPLYEALSPKRLIIHGADYDLRLLSRFPAFTATDIFDTSIAARFAGETQFGLAALVQNHFGVSLSKSSQRANWALRPLSPVMQDYALNDVCYLHRLALLLEEKLRQLNRWEWYLQTRDQMVRAAREPRQKDPADAWQITGSAALQPREAAVLRALWQWRDGEASRWDRPPFHVMSNEALLAAARTAAAGGRPSVPRRMPGPRLQRFHQAVETALALPPEEWPVRERIRSKRPGAEECRRFEQLRARRDSVARELALDPSLLAPKHALMAAATEPATAPLLPWQRQLLHLPPPLPPA